MNTRSTFRFPRLALGFVLLCSLILGDVGQASAGSRCYVKADATGLNNGTSWGDAYKDLQWGLGGSPCTEIWVARGTYQPTSTTDRTFSFILKNGVAIYGGFAGTETQPGERNPAVNVTVLSGEIGDPGVTTDNSYHVVIGSYANSTALLDGFTITAGNASDGSGGGMINGGSGSPSLANLVFSHNTANNSGGGLYNGGNSTTSLTHVTFTANSAAWGGGGMYNSPDSSPVLMDVTFSGNSTTGSYGGGMYNDVNSSPLLLDAVFSNNSAPHGGGIYNDGSSMTLSNALFEGNSATRGGGIYNNNSSPSLTNISFNGNTATDGGGMYNSNAAAASPVLTTVTFSQNSAVESGGGLFNMGGSPTLTNVNFSVNSAQYGAGMYSYGGSPSLMQVSFDSNAAAWSGGGLQNVNNSNPSLTNVSFTNNSALQGGGMSNSHANPILSNVTFSANTAGGDGGGMMGSEGSLVLTNVTFSGNSAGRWGGAMELGWISPASLTNVTFNGNTAAAGGGIHHSGNSSPTITNSILYGDTGGEIAFALSSPTVSYSIIQGGYPGTGNLNANPLLGPLQNNGGSTQTMALGIGSPAVDRGKNASCPAKDQRGTARPQGPRCDMGAYERPQSTLNVYGAGAQDGWVLESLEASGTGGTMSATAALLLVGDNAQDKQYRSILSFNTGILPDNAVITSATLKLRDAGSVGVNPFTTHGSLLVDVRKGAFTGSGTLELKDFQAPASKDAVMSILNNPVGGWYSKTLAAAGSGYINKAGPTQFRLRFAKDDNDDLSADYLKFYSGNNLTPAYRPKLIITYYVP